MTEHVEDPPPGSLASTSLLLERVQSGDERAREELFARFLPVLRRWAHRRLPASARDLHETDDLVQVTLMRALSNLDRFDHRGEGAFFAYLRNILLNLVRDEIRRVARRRAPAELRDEQPDPGPSVVEQLIGRETLDRYEAALASLPEEQRELIILSVEMGLSHRQVAEALRRPSADAARMAIARSLVKLAEAMDERR